MAWQDTSADAVRCVRIISREVPACTVPDVSFLYMASVASLAQLVEHALRKRMVVGSIPTGGSIAAVSLSRPTRQSTAD